MTTGATFPALAAARERGAHVAPSPSVSDGSGVFATSPDALRRRLIGPWAEGIRQYLAIRLGDGDRAIVAFREVARLVAALPPSAIVEAPGPKAQVYRLARRVAAELRARSGLNVELLVYREPPEASRGYRNAIERARRELRADDSELLELRYARELTVAEIACVLGEEASDVELRLDLASARARHALGRHAPDPSATLGGAFVDVFALAPRREAEPPPLPTDASLPEGTRIGGRYLLARRVGCGAFGDVYLAEDDDVPGHRVALKLLREPSLSSAAREAALRELKMTAAVFHPSVVQLKDHGWFEDRLFFVMPWYEGETLAVRLMRGSLERSEALAIFQPLCRALATLHASGIRHQDIKPDNVFLARVRGGEEDEILPVLLDLGVAAAEHEALLGGTPVYFAPEVAACYARLDSSENVTQAADVFALALTLRNALEPETEEDVPAGAIEAFVERRASSRPPLPMRRDLRFLRPHFGSWLAVDPLQRPSAEELVSELEVLTLPEERREARRKVLSWFLPTAFALGAIVAVVGWAYARERAHQGQLLARARSETVSVREHLASESARLDALSGDHEGLVSRYEESRLTAGELRAELGRGEARERALSSQAERFGSERDALREVLTEARRTLAERDATLVERDSALADKDRSIALLRTESESLGQRLEDERARGERERAEATRRAAELSTRVEAASLELDAERAARHAAETRIASFERRAQAAEAAHQEASAELARLRVRIEALRAQLSPARPAPRAAEPTAPLDSAAPGEEPPAASPLPEGD